MFAGFLRRWRRRDDVVASVDYRGEFVRVGFVTSGQVGGLLVDMLGRGLAGRGLSLNWDPGRSLSVDIPAQLKSPMSAHSAAVRKALKEMPAGYRDFFNKIASGEIDLVVALETARVAGLLDSPDKGIAAANAIWLSGLFSEKREGRGVDGSD